MVRSRIFEPPDLLATTVTGLFTADDQASLVEWVRESIRTLGSVRLLIVLDGFGGWIPIGTFDSPLMWLRDDEPVMKIAVVGDPHWRIPILTFSAQPIRRIPIEYFATEAAARAWLQPGGASPVAPHSEPAAT